MVCHPNRITIESKPCYVIQSKTMILTPRVDHCHFSQSVFPFPCFTQEWLSPLYCPPSSSSHFESITDKTSQKNPKQQKFLAFQYQYHSRLFWEFERSPPSFIVFPLGSGTCMCQSCMMGNSQETMSPIWVETGLGAFPHAFKSLLSCLCMSPSTCFHCQQPAPEN